MGAAKKKNSKILPILLGLCLLVVVFVAFKVLGPNAKKSGYFYVRTGWNYEAMMESLRDSGFLKDEGGFNMLAHQLKLQEHVRPGRYQIKKGMSSYSIVKMLRNGRQAPVKLVINKLRTKQEFIDMLSAKLEEDSAALKSLLTNQTWLSAYGLDENTVMCGIVPDTYEMYWNTNPEKALKKLLENYNKFWTDERKQQAQQKGMRITDVTIMASIVEEETNVKADKPLIASVYLNRIKKGMKLQADPTVKFAVGDFTIKRIGGNMLKNTSHYNTYMYAGLPPGPICTPSPSSVDAVLQAPATDYIYFCAKADLKGGSAFAATDAEHLKNAKAYQQALNERGIH